MLGVREETNGKRDGREGERERERRNASEGDKSLAIRDTRRRRGHRMLCKISKTLERFSKLGYSTLKRRPQSNATVSGRLSWRDGCDRLNRDGFCRIVLELRKLVRGVWYPMQPTSVVARNTSGVAR